jgi:hypothetical protein
VALAAAISCWKVLCLKPELAGMYFDLLGCVEPHASGSV